MLVIHPIQELPRVLPALLGLLVAGSGSGRGPLWSLVGLAIVVTVGTLRWFTTTYRVTPDCVQVRRGLLRRRELSVPRDRVRTVDVTAHLMHRALGLARVVVRTGRSDRKDDTGIKLDALTADQAGRLRTELLHRGDPTSASQAPAAAAAAAVEVELARLRPGWICFAPFTLSGFAAVGLVAAFGSRAVSEAHLDPSRFGPLQSVTEQLTRAPLGLAIAEVVLVVLVVVAVASTVGYVLAFWGFRLARYPNGTLRVTRGLVTTRATTIEERRLRGVEISEPLLLRVVRGARCIAVATGLRVGRGAERGGSMLVPPAPRHEVAGVASAVLRSHRPLACPLVPHGPRARRRRFTRALGSCAPLIGAVALLAWRLSWPAWTWQASLLLLPASALLAFDRYRSLGHAYLDGWLVTSWGTLVRRRCVLAADGICGWQLRRSFFQRRAGLATLTATMAAGRQGYPVRDIALGEAVRIADQTTRDLLTPFLDHRHETRVRGESRSDTPPKLRGKPRTAASAGRRTVEG